MKSENRNGQPAAIKRYRIDVRRPIGRVVQHHASVSRPVFSLPQPLERQSSAVVRSSHDVSPVQPDSRHHRKIRPETRGAADEADEGSAGENEKKLRVKPKTTCASFHKSARALSHVVHRALLPRLATHAAASSHSATGRRPSPAPCSRRSPPGRSRRPMRPSVARIARSPSRQARHVTSGWGDTSPVALADRVPQRARRREHEGAVRVHDARASAPDLHGAARVLDAPRLVHELRLVVCGTARRLRSFPRAAANHTGESPTFAVVKFVPSTTAIQAVRSSLIPDDDALPRLVEGL